MCCSCAEVFKKALQVAMAVLVVLNKWKDSEYKKRIWTIYENHVAAELGIQPRMVLPAAEEKSLINALESDRQQVVTEFRTTDVENATASVKGDEYAIKAMICQSIGFDKLNEEFMSSLVRCASQLRERELLAEVKRQPELLPGVGEAEVKAAFSPLPDCIFDSSRRCSAAPPSAHSVQHTKAAL